MGCNNSKSVETSKKNEPQEKTERNQETEKEAKDTPVEKRDWFTIEEAEAHVVKELGVTEEVAKKIVESVESEDDSDDKITKNELDELNKVMTQAKEEIEPLFQEKDTDKNMYVSVDDCVEILQKKYPSFTEEQLRSIAKSFDVDNNDQCRYGEFILFYGHIKANKEKMLNKFEKLDKDNSGKLTYKELKPILEKKGRARYWSQSLFDINAGKDHKIDKLEFRKMLNKLAGEE